MSFGFNALMVQSGFTAADYRDAETFHDKVMVAASGIDQGSLAAIRLIVFPELTGMWIPVLTARRISRSLPALAARRILASPLKAASSILSGCSLSFAFLEGWAETLHHWIEPFRELARRCDAYVCPGSSFLPLFDWEVATGLRRKGRRLYNTSCLINPRGTILGFTRKVNLTRDERLLGIKPGDLRDLVPYQTELGSIGILVCKDGFHERAVEQLDRQGCQIALMPSANPKPWDKPPRRGAALSQEAEWLSQGLGSLIQGRENIGVSINPMSVSSVLGHRDEGRSNAFVNLKQREPAQLQPGHSEVPESYRRYPGLEIVSSSHDREETTVFILKG
jgi:predicted amidohydrolase